VHIEQNNIYVPSDNVGTWRGIFEPSTATFEAERERAHNIFVLYAQYNYQTETFRNRLLNMFLGRFPHILGVGLSFSLHYQDNIS
jgi:hypothetical protein